MKSKYHNERKIIEYILTTDKFKTIFLLAVVISLYGGFVLGASINNFFDSILLPFSFSIFNIMFFSLVFFNNIILCSILNKEFSYYIMRLKTRKKYIGLLLRLSIVMFLILFFIVFCFILMCLFLTTFKDLSIHNYYNYSISNFVYCIFYLIRYILYGIVITIIFSLIYINTNLRITLIFSGLFLICMLCFGKVVVGRNNVSFLIWSFFSITVYSSFNLEIISFLIMLLLLEVIAYFLYIFSINNRKMEIL